MSNKIFIIIQIQLLFLLFSYTYQNSSKNEKSSQVKIYSFNSGLLGDPFDDDTEPETRDKNCNMTEYPEQAIRCNNETMICSDEKRLHHCSCKEGYITYAKDDNFTFCTYQQKKQLYAFLLELLVGFGAGHFYRQDYTMASLKLVAFVAGIVFIFTFPITAKALTDSEGCDCDACAIILSIIYYLYLCGLAIWYIWDLVNFGKNEYLDFSYFDEIGKGISFEPW